LTFSSGTAVGSGSLGAAVGSGSSGTAVGSSSSGTAVGSGSSGTVVGSGSVGTIVGSDSITSGCVVAVGSGAIVDAQADINDATIKRQVIIFNFSDIYKLLGFYWYIENHESKLI
jgi:hypothetical protein